MNEKRLVRRLLDQLESNAINIILVFLTAGGLGWFAFQISGIAQMATGFPTPFVTLTFASIVFGFILSLLIDIRTRIDRRHEERRKKQMAIIESEREEERLVERFRELDFGAKSLVGTIYIKDFFDYQENEYDYNHKNEMVSRFIDASGYLVFETVSPFIVRYSLRDTTRRLIDKYPDLIDPVRNYLSQFCSE